VVSLCYYYYATTYKCTVTETTVQGVDTAKDKTQKVSMCGLDLSLASVSLLFSGSFSTNVNSDPCGFHHILAFNKSTSEIR